MGADAPNGDPVAWVGLEDLADEVHALPGEVQVAGEAVLHAHDALQGRQQFNASGRAAMLL